MGEEATLFPFEQLGRGGISKSGALKGLTAIPILSMCVYTMSPVVPNGLVAGRLLDPLVMVFIEVTVQGSSASGLTLTDLVPHQ